jgi:hypothetical protein
MNRSVKAILVLTSLIALLALLAAGLGLLWQGQGQPFEFHTLRGETVMIQGHGLYRYDTVSLAAQAIAQDLVTLVVAIPLLVVATVLFVRGRLRGKLLLAGTLGYFLYTYASYAFNVAYNELFLVYVALFSLSLFDFVLALMTVDLATLPKRFSPRLPRRTIAIFMFAVAGLLLLNWLGRIVPPLLANEVPLDLESYHTLIIQAMDLAVVVPAVLLSGVLLWGRRPWGYLLSSVALIKLFTLALAVSAMSVNQILAGVRVGIGGAMFPAMALVGVALTVTLLRKVTDPVSALPAR